MRLLIAFTFTLLLPSVSCAGLALSNQFFDTTIGTGGGTYSQTQTFMIDDLTFDATLTVVGSGDINVTSNGLAVDTPGFGFIGEEDHIDNGESVTYSLTISNVTPGISLTELQFVGFSTVQFSEFDDSDQASINGGVSIGPTDLNLSNEAGGFGLLTSLTVEESAGLPGSRFNLSGITANFVATPEPSSLALAFGVIPVLFRRRRRSRR